MCAENRILNQALTPEICYELLPEWSGLKVEISQLNGGITNKLYRIQSPKGDYTVRIYGDNTDLFINREHEADTIEKMSAIGVGSKLVKYMPDIGVTIVEFIGDAIVLTNDHFLDVSLYPLIVEPIRRIHSSGVQLKKIFDPLVEVMRMWDILSRLEVSYPEFDMDKILQKLNQLSRVISLPESEYVACHNDLLADNFILIKEEHRHRYKSPMYIIDWEYGGMGPRYYDIADMFQEILIPRDKEKAIIAEYEQDEVHLDQAIYNVDLFKPFPDIYWFLWSLIQLNISKIEFDYYNYGKVKHKNAVKNLTFLRKSYGVAI